jgi:hypothetical protein
LGGGKLQLFFHGVKGRLNLATHFGVSIWWIHSASQFDKFIQRVNLASSFSGFFEKERKSNRKEKKACIIL